MTSPSVVLFFLSALLLGSFRGLQAEKDNRDSHGPQKPYSLSPDRHHDELGKLGEELGEEVHTDSPGSGGYYPEKMVLVDLVLNSWITEAERDQTARFDSKTVLRSDGVESEDLSEPLVSDFVKPGGKKKILSVGEGFGGFLKYAVNHKIDFTAVDLDYTDPPSKQMKKYINENVRLIKGDASKLPLGIGKFDLVVGHALLINIQDGETRQRMIGEAFNSLNNGGQLRFDFQSNECIDLLNKKPRDTNGARSLMKRNDYIDKIRKEAAFLTRQLPKDGYRFVVKFGSATNKFTSSTPVATLILEKTNDSRGAAYPAAAQSGLNMNDEPRHK